MTPLTEGVRRCEWEAYPHPLPERRGVDLAIRRVHVRVCGYEHRQWQSRAPWTGYAPLVLLSYPSYVRRSRGSRGERIYVVRLAP